MGWIDHLTNRIPKRGLGGLDVADVAARANVLASALDDGQRVRDTSPPAVAGWRYQGGSWLRWSELEGAYRAAPVPMALATYGRSLGAPPEGHTVALIDGEWREVTDGAAPLRAQADAPVPDPLRPGPPATQPPPLLPPSAVSGEVPSAAPVAVPSAEPTSAPAAPARHEPPTPKPSVADQLAAWRRRNSSPDR